MILHHQPFVLGWPGPFQQQWGLPQLAGIHNYKPAPQTTKNVKFGRCWQYCLWVYDCFCMLPNQKNPVKIKLHVTWLTCQASPPATFWLSRVIAQHLPWSTPAPSHRASAMACGVNVPGQALAPISRLMARVWGNGDSMYKDAKVPGDVTAEFHHSDATTTCSGWVSPFWMAILKMLCWFPARLGFHPYYCLWTCVCVCFLLNGEPRISHFPTKGAVKEANKYPSRWIIQFAQKNHVESLIACNLTEP